MLGHTNMGNLASLPLKCIYQISSPSQTKERGWKAHYFFIHGLFFWLISFIRPEAKEKSYKERFFHAMRAGLLWYGFLQLNEWREEYEERSLYEDSNKKKKGQTISYWKIWLNEEKLFMRSHFTTIWNARNFDWWKPVHEDSPFSYVQFPSFGKHLVSQQMNISLSLSCSLYVVWKLLQGSNE